MRTARQSFGILLTVLFVVLPGVMQSAAAQNGAGYDELLALFADWREFESPPMLDGAPDYTANGFAARYESFLVLRNRLHRIDPGDWPVAHEVDWHIVRAPGRAGRGGDVGSVGTTARAHPAW